MTSKSILGILILIFICISIIPAVSAEVQEGTLSGSGYQSYNFVVSGFYGANIPANGFYVHNIQNTAGAKSLIRYGIPTYSTPNSSGQVPCKFYTQAGTQIGSGTFGYQRLYSDLGVELSSGYFYATMDSWDVTGLTGNMNINISYSEADLGQTIKIVKTTDPGATTPPVSGWMSFSLGSSYAFDGEGTYTYNTDKTFANIYTVTKPAGLGISGVVGKLYYGKTYPSKVFIVDGTSGINLASESAYNTNNFTFSVNAQTIIIAAQDSFGTFHNSSTLFAVTTKDYTFQINPNPAAPNSSISVTLSSVPIGDLSELSYIDGVIKNNVGDQVTTGVIYSVGNSFNYQKTQSGTWYRYNFTSGTFSDSMGTSTPSTFGFKMYDSGNYTMEWSLYDIYGHSFLELTPFSIGSTGYSLSIYPVDYSTGGFVSNSQVDVQNYLTGIWTNRTVTKPSDCVFPVTNGFYKYIVYAPTGSNYQPTNQVVTGININGKGESITVPIYPKSTNDVYNTTVFVEVQDSEELQPLYGAQVSVPLLGYSGTTTLSGTLSFNATNQTNYAITTSANGYTTDTTYFTASGQSMTVVIVLEKGSGAVTYVTTVPITIPTTTLAPTPTLQGYQTNGTFTGFWGPFENMFVSMGATPGTVGLLMTVLLCLALGIAGAVVTNNPMGGGNPAIGFEAGMVSGFIFSCAFQFISLYFILIAVAWLILRVVIKQYS